MKRRSVAALKGSAIIRRAEDLRLLADPKRLRIFEALRDEPASPHQLAQRFGMKPTALYYHFQKLERAGFIEVARTQRRRGVVERLYGAAVDQVVVDRSLLQKDARSVQAVLAAVSAIVRVTIEDVRAAALDPSEPLADRERSEVATIAVRTSPAKARALMRRLRALLELARASDGSGDARVRLTLAMVPLAGTAGHARRTGRRGREASNTMKSRGSIDT